MQQKILIALLFLASIQLVAQTSYTGFIDKYPVEFVTDLNSEGSGDAIYTYSNYDTPI